MMVDVPNAAGKSRKEKTDMIKPSEFGNMVAGMLVRAVLMEWWMKEARIQ